MAARTRLRSFPHIRLPEYAELVVFLGFVWGVGDTVTTVLAAHVTGSVAGELNPLVRTLLEADPAVAILLKGGVAVVACVVLVAAREQVTDVPGWRVWFLGMIAVGTLIVAQNLSVVFVASY
ncbi:DUF5658 family protein [Halorhabdus tiamatea]|nr:DUF5658 family protein [Halorhabdus tiamatea]